MRIDYHKKYLKYKNKYLILQKYIGGLYEGNGSRGVVVSNPRLPFIDETYEAIKDSSVNEVSKIYFNNKYYSEDVETIELINKEYHDIIILDYFVLPLRCGEINKENINNNKAIYNDAWLSNDSTIIVSFTQILQNDIIYQITYEKGEKLDNLMAILSTPSIEESSGSLADSSLNFLLLMKNPIVGINNVHTFNIYFKDIKWDNMLYINGKIKNIDYFDIFNFFEKTDEYIRETINDDKFINNIFYDANNPLSSLLILYYTTSMTNIEYYNILIEYKKTDNGKYQYIDNMRVFLNNIVAQYTTKKSMGMVDISIDVQLVDGTSVPINFIDVLNTLRAIYGLLDKNKQIINHIVATYKTELDKITDLKYRINTLLQTNNMYAIGSIFIYYIYYCNTRRISIDPDDYINIAKIIIICYGKIVFQDDNVYITNSTFDTVIQFYESIGI